MICFRSKLAVVFGVVAIAHCHAQANELPHGWIETVQPSEQISSGSTLACANYSAHEWHVSASPLGVQVVDSPKEKVNADVLPPNFVLTKEMRGHPTAIKTADGWLVGFDAGEFGGGLWWSSNDGKTTNSLSEENVHALIPRGDRVLVLTGLDHMGSNVGAIYAYRPSTAPALKSLTFIVGLDSSPDAASLTVSGDLFVVTQGSVLIFSKDNQLETLFRFPAMATLYPDSIVVINEGKLFIGMRFYVLELLSQEHSRYVAKWFVTSECRKARVRNYDCVCSAGSQ